MRQEDKILRSKLGKRLPVTEADRRTFVLCGLLNHYHADRPAA